MELLDRVEHAVLAGKRSLAETAFYRYKILIGRRLRARTLSAQKVEVRIAAEPRTEFGKGGARRTRRAGKGGILTGSVEQVVAYYQAMVDQLKAEGPRPRAGPSIPRDRSRPTALRATPAASCFTVSWVDSLCGGG